MAAMTSFQPPGKCAWRH